MAKEEDKKIEKESVVKLRVVEALQDDAYKGIARVDANLMKKMKLQRGDIISIKGSRETFVVVDRGYPSDTGENIIRIDGITRKNAKTGIGEQVTIKKAELKEAKKITIAPSQKGIMIQIQGDPEGLKQRLIGMGLAKGDLLVLGASGGQRRKDPMSDEFGDLFSDFSDIFSQMGMMGGFQNPTQIRFIVANISPNQPGIITENTEITINPKAMDISEDDSSSAPPVTYEDIGGLTDEVKKIREMVELPLKHPEIFDRLGIEPPKGVLLFGPPGTGKTLLAKAVAGETEAHFILLNGPEIMSKFYGESEKKVREIFDEAEKNAPSIIFIDEIDAIAPKREDATGEVEKRVVSQLLTMMDGLKSRGKVVVIGATNRPDSLDPALRRPGRFDREIEVGVPDKRGRLAIIKIHTRGMPLIPPAKKEYIEKKANNLKNSINEMEIEVKKNPHEEKSKDTLREIENNKDTLKVLELLVKEMTEDEKKNEILIKKIGSKEDINSILIESMIDEIASKTHGFVGADISSLAKEAAMAVLRRNLNKFNLEEDNEVPQELLAELKITKNDFDDALKTVRPSAMREVLVETPTTKWTDVGGIEPAKQELKEAVEWPLKYQSSFERMGVKPPKGVLLYGPPGTGKTLLAKAVAKESESNFIQIKGPELLSMWVGKSEEGVRKIFEKARQVSPCVIFFDEIDSLAGRRGMDHNGNNVTERVLNQILAEMDGIESLKNVIVIGATNRPDMLDPALLRPGRFDRIVYVPVPDKEGRIQILNIHTKNMPIVDKEKVVKEMAEKTEGYTGADIEGLCREAAMLALREDIEVKEITKKNFEKAMNKVLPSVTKNDADRYQNIEKKYLRSAKSALPETSYAG